MEEDRYIDIEIERDMQGDRKTVQRWGKRSTGETIRKRIAWEMIVKKIIFKKAKAGERERDS